MTIDPSKPPTSAWGCLFRIGVAIVAVSIPILVAVVVYVAREQQKHVAALANEVQAIRARGEPLSSNDLARFYSLPEGVTDITPIYLAALKPLEDKERFARLQRLKPFCTLHKPQEEPPLRPRVWEQLAAAEEELQPFRDFLEKVEAAAKHTGGVRYLVDFSQGWEAPIPQAMLCRDALPALELQAICRYQRGEFTHAADTIIATIRLGETLRYEPLLASQLTRISILRVGMRLTTYVAADKAFPAADLARIQAAFAEIEFESIRVPVFLGERACGHLTHSQPVQQERMVDLKMPAGTVLTKSRPGDCATLLNWQRESIEAAKLPMPQALAAAESLEQRYMSANYDAHRLPHWMKNYVTHHDFLMPRDILKWLGRIETECRAAVAFCACERFHRTHQDEVVRLVELVPEFLAAVPEDPFTGQPLSSVRWTDREYAIYGFGQDGVDNSGDGVGQADGEDVGIKSFAERRPTKAAAAAANDD